jgi:hypothetical protein
MKGWMFSFRAEGLFCSLGVLYEGLGIVKLQFLIKQISNFFSAVIFFNFWSSKAWIRIGFQPKMLDSDLVYESRSEMQPFLPNLKILQWEREFTVQVFTFMFIILAFRANNVVV